MSARAADKAISTLTTLRGLDMRLECRILCGLAETSEIHKD